MFPRLPSVRQFHDPELRLDRLEGAAADQAGLLASDLQSFDHVLLAAELARGIDVDLHAPAGLFGDVPRESSRRQVPAMALAEHMAEFDVHLRGRWQGEEERPQDDESGSEAKTATHE